MFQAWWLLEGKEKNILAWGSMEKHPCVGVNGKTSLLGDLWKKKKTSFSPPSIFHLKRFYLNLIPIDFNILFYHGSRPLFHVFPSFSLIYKLHSCVLMYYVFHTHYQIDFD
jgi:hypothetical protein